MKNLLLVCYYFAIALGVVFLTSSEWTILGAGLAAMSPGLYMLALVIKNDNLLEEPILLHLVPLLFLYTDAAIFASLSVLLYILLNVLSSLFPYSINDLFRAKE